MLVCINKIIFLKWLKIPRPKITVTKSAKQLTVATINFEDPLFHFAN